MGQTMYLLADIKIRPVESCASTAGVASPAPRVHALSGTLITPSVPTPMRNGSAAVVAIGVGRRSVGGDDGALAALRRLHFGRFART
jgi:hypothetical protein